MKPSAGLVIAGCRWHLVRGDLEFHELVVREVAIEGIDDPGAVLVGVGIEELGVVADLVRLVLRIARERQP
jgi:hypothetical protein